MFDLAGPYCGDGLEEPDPAALFLPRYALPVRWRVFDHCVRTPVLRRRRRGTDDPSGQSFRDALL